MSHPPDPLAERLRALPAFDPPADGWARLARQLTPTRRHRWVPLALAAGFSVLGAALLLRTPLFLPTAAAPEAGTAWHAAATPALPSEPETALLLAAYSDDRDDLINAVGQLLSSEDDTAAPSLLQQEDWI